MSKEWQGTVARVQKFLPKVTASGNGHYGSCDINISFPNPHQSNTFLYKSLSYSITLHKIYVGSLNVNECPQLDLVEFYQYYNSIPRALVPSMFSSVLVLRAFPSTI